MTIAEPVLFANRKADGIAIPLTRHSSLLDSNDSINLDAISSHGTSVMGKILRGLYNYEMKTGTVHPFTVKRSESGLGTRGASVPLTAYQNEVRIGEISIGTPLKTLEGKFFWHIVSVHTAVFVQFNAVICRCWSLAVLGFPEIATSGTPIHPNLMSTKNSHFSSNI